MNSLMTSPTNGGVSAGALTWANAPPRHHIVAARRKIVMPFQRGSQKIRGGFFVGGVTGRDGGGGKGCVTVRKPGGITSGGRDVCLFMFTSKFPAALYSLECFTNLLE